MPSVKRLNAAASLAAKTAVYDDVEVEEDNKKSEDEIEKTEEVVKPEVVPVEEPVKPVKPEVVPVEEPVKPEVTTTEEDEGEFDYLSVPGKKDSAAVTRAKIEGKKRKELEKDLASRDTRIAELEALLKEKEVLGPEAAPAKPSFNLDENDDYKAISAEFGKNRRKMELSATDPKWVRENFGALVTEFQQVENSGNDDDFLKFRDTYSAKTGLEPASLVTMLSNASELASRAQKIADELKVRAEEGTLNEGYNTYEKGVKGTQELLEGFVSTLDARAEADADSVYAFLKESLQDPEDSKRMKAIEKDIVTLLHGPVQYSSKELAKLRASGQDLNHLSTANIKKAEARKKALVPMVAAGLFVLSKFPDLYKRAVEEEDEVETVRKIKKIGKKAEVAPVKEEKKEETVDLLSQFVKNGGRL